MQQARPRGTRMAAALCWTLREWAPKRPRPTRSKHAPRSARTRAFSIETVNARTWDVRVTHPNGPGQPLVLRPSCHGLGPGAPGAASSGPDSGPGRLRTSARFTGLLVVVEPLPSEAQGPWDPNHTGRRPLRRRRRCLRRCRRRCRAWGLPPTLLITRLLGPPR